MVRQDGFKYLIKTGYKKYLRLFLPNRLNEYNGVMVPNGKLFDQVVPWVEGNRPQYETGLAAGLRDVTQLGDSVVIVGGGWGVTAVIAARQAGRDGEVIVYEGSSENVDKVRATAELNSVSEQITVNHAIVGEKISLRGPAENAEIISPKQLPECNVLELDCEGAEKVILDRITIRPRNILVESHGHLGAPPVEIQSLLETLSYEVINSGPADMGREQICRDNEVIVFKCTLNNE